jgi:hypothetical protein
MPAYLVPNTTYNIVFIIESHEKSSTDYLFKVYLNDTVIKRGKVSLNPGKIAQVPVEFSVGNVTYKKVLIWEKTTVYNMSGVYDIAGKEINTENTPTINGSCPFGSAGYLPPAYPGPSNLSLLMNTSKNVTIVKTIENRENTGRSVEYYRLTLLKLGEDRYKLILKESKVKYIPEAITIRVVVETSNGKAYQVFKSWPVMEGG